MSKKKNSECLSGVEVSPSPAGRTAILQLPRFWFRNLPRQESWWIVRAPFSKDSCRYSTISMLNRNCLIATVTWPVRYAMPVSLINFSNLSNDAEVSVSTLSNSSRSCNPDFTQVPFPDTERRPCPGAVIYSGKLTPTIEKPDSSNSSIPRISLPHNGKKARWIELPMREIPVLPPYGHDLVPEEERWWRKMGADNPA